ncbi:twisted gastrulation protein homolog 1 [Elysia marginata]|uniref:Twisted gastrulation protein homolog 1 n=1 Tax=Elysia marginata TaxID=1093978 RepID=A0AAV4J260_9GAST|nr:twisted gastrulation protein homolog 1 [Elysia marginata]
MNPLNKLLLTSLLVITSVLVAETCNEVVCGPLVSKCMLINCCDCEMTDLTNCTCCRECQLCLSKLYTECCSCVGLCPPPDLDDELDKGSTVEHLKDPIPALFDVLTEQEDPQQRWTSFTYAIDLNLENKSSIKPLHRGVTISKNADDIVVDGNTAEGKPNSRIHNCTTAFFSSCMPVGKCKASCKSMGASKYRWFHEHGCCQCIGSTCFDYGLIEPRCLKCPEPTETTFGDQPYSWADNVKMMYQADTFDMV